VTHGEVFVAERFGGWQEVALRALAGAYDAKKAAFSPEVYGAVQEAIKAAAEAGADPALEVGRQARELGC
jgi:hypothetical protein